MLKRFCLPPVLCLHFCTHSGDDTFIIGGVDFPVPTGENGAGVRFPFAGAFEQGTSPVAYAHGHAFNPAAPFHFETLDDMRRKKT